MNSEVESRSIRKILKPLGILPVLFAYILGVSIAHYLGGKIDLSVTVIGLLTCLLIRDMRNFLCAYFDHPESYHSTLNLNDPDREMLLQIRRPLLLIYSLVILAAGASLAMVLIYKGVFTTSVFLLLGIALLLNFFAAVPPPRFSRKGYDELIEALFITNLVPAIAFSLTGMPLSLLIIQLTLPLTLIYLAMKIALSFEGYGFDSIHGRHTLTTRFGWQTALIMHNIFILSAFVLVAIFLLMGLPWSLSWPLLLALPVGGLQILYLQSIANGVKPKWRFLRWLTVGLFIMMVYLEIISLWF